MCNIQVIWDVDNLLLCIPTEIKLFFGDRKYQKEQSILFNRYGSVETQPFSLLIRRARLHAKCKFVSCCTCDHCFGIANEDALPVSKIRVKPKAFVRPYDHKSASINQNRGSVSVW